MSCMSVFDDGEMRYVLGQVGSSGDVMREGEQVAVTRLKMSENSMAQQEDKRVLKAKSIEQ